MNRLLQEQGTADSSNEVEYKPSPCEWGSPLVGQPTLPQNELHVSMHNLRLERQQKKNMKRFICACAIFSAASLIAIILFGVFTRYTKDVLETKRSYISNVSGLTFKYPSSWEKKDAEYLKELSKNNNKITQGNETVLMKRGGAMFKHLFVVSNAQMNLENSNFQSWDEVVSSFEESIGEQLGSQGYAGTFYHLNLPLEKTEWGSKTAWGFQVMYTVKPKIGPTVQNIESIIIKGNTIYSLLLVTPLDIGGSDEMEARYLMADLATSVSIK